MPSQAAGADDVLTAVLFSRDRPLQLHGNGECVPVEDGSVEQLDGEFRPPACGERLILPLNARRDGREVDGRVFTEPAKNVVGGLRIVNSAREGLKAEQTDRLLVQLVHCGAAELAGRHQNRGCGKAHGGCPLQAVEKQG